MAEQRRREFREGEIIQYLRDPGSRNIEWSPGIISSFVKYIIRNNQTGRTSERIYQNVRREGVIAYPESTRIGDTVLASGRGQAEFEGTVADKIFSIEIRRQDGSRSWRERSSYEIRRPGEEAMQRPARPQRQAQAPAPQAQAPAPAQAPQPQAAPAPAPQRQLPQPTAVEPNPPYQPGSYVECLADDPNTGREVWNPALIRIISAFVIANEQTGRVVERTRTDVFTLTGAPSTNSNVRIGDTVLYYDGDSRVRGIVMDKIYYVSYTNTRGVRFFREKKTGEIRRPQGQAAAAIAQPQPVVAPPLPQPTEAVAFEIHNAFDSFKFEKFMDIVRKNSNFKNRDAPLKPLIDNVNANPKLSPEKKTELAEKIERIFTTLRQYSNYDRNINNIMDCIQYVLMQPQDFIDIYIDTFVTDCLKAYSTGSAQSCVKGMYERVYFAFRDTVSTICLDQIQGTGAAPLCKPEYIEIFNCFYEDMPTEMLNDYAQQWFQERGEAAGNLNEEARIEDFVGFVRSKVNNVSRFRQAERSVRRYAATNINVLFGGRRKRSVKKTVKRRKNKTMKKRGNRKTRKQ